MTLYDNVSNHMVTREQYTVAEEMQTYTIPSVALNGVLMVHVVRCSIELD